ncbi:MAG TPA: bifunctional diguanylate cyclase/phosphodiesterase [Pyrinomonadaceae bacterium]|nr:bifunctional diguanylate cyclase/phosphodiesterase [Pyrinomonadaceae bacterium]
MEKKERNINIFSIVLLPLGVLAFVSAVFSFPVEKISITLIALSVLTIFFSSYLKIQLPRTKIHLTVSETLIFFSLLYYGGEVAVLLAAFESLYASLSMRREGLNLKIKTIAINIAVSVVSTFASAWAIKKVFSSPESVLSGDNTMFIGVLLVMVLSQFAVNSIFVAIAISIKTEKTMWQVWNEYCLNALVMYIGGAFMAGLGIKAIDQVDAFMIIVAAAVSAVVYMTYRRYVNDVKETAAKAEQAERERAEQAERHIEELQHHIAEQDRIGQALRESKEKFRHAAFHDALTDLPNRNLFMETLKFALEKSKHNASFKFAVLFLDINRFKTINDSLGHSMGDRLILHVAKRLATSVREKDLVARFSGDEFAFILNNIADIEDAKQFAELIKHKISAPFTLNGRQVFTSFSIGIALGSKDYEVAEDILRDADIAMYHAKDGEKDFIVFDKNMHTRAVTLLQLETDLRHAIERNELCMFYQPIVDLDSMRLFGFESLIRWNHPTRGLVPPNEFIPVSEDTGLIVPMTLWILRTSCKQIVEWQRLCPANKNLVVSVNISGKHFAQKDLVEQIKTILVETEMNPACLKLELTESAVMENAESVIAMMKQIRELGIQLSIDDFGTGYSSLSYLHRFPINTLKVDRSFVNSMEDGSENGEIVRTVIALAKTLRLNVVAEGIETIHQLHQLRILGCEFGQGYLFSRPVPVEEAERLINDASRFENIIPYQILPPLPNADVPHLRLAK